MLIDGKNKYLPQIRNGVLQEHAAISEKLRTGTLTEQDFSYMFEQHESNFVLRTLQAIHSTSYRDDVWSESFNANVMESMTRILEQVAEIVPPERSKKVFDQVDTLLQRGNRNSEYGSRFYDHSYSNIIDTQRLGEIKQKLAEKLIPYERRINPTKEEQRENRGQVLQLEDVNISAITERNSQRQAPPQRRTTGEHVDDAR